MHGRVSFTVTLNSPRFTCMKLIHCNLTYVGRRFGWYRRYREDLHSLLALRTRHTPLILRTRRALLLVEIAQSRGTIASPSLSTKPFYLSVLFTVKPRNVDWLSSYWTDPNNGNCNTPYGSRGFGWVYVYGGYSSIIYFEPPCDIQSSCTRNKGGKAILPIIANHIALLRLLFAFMNFAKIKYKLSREIYILVSHVIICI